MKRFLIVLLVFMLVSGLVSQTLQLESFRHQSTYAIDDDLDDAVDGTDLYEVSGARIFTNLSNLSSGGEQLMGYNSDNTLVIGYVTSEFMGMKGAFFWGSLKNLTPDALSLDLNDDGAPDISGNGFLTGDWSREWDVNDDGSMDFMEYRYGMEAGEDATQESDILINLAREMGDSRIALTYMRTASNFASDESDSVYYMVEDLSTDDIQSYERTNSVDDVENSYPSNNLYLSYETPFMDWYLRGNLTFSMADVNSVDIYEYNYYEDLAASSTTITDVYTSMTDNNNMDNYSRNRAGFSARLRNEDEELNWWATGHFGMTFGSGDYESVNMNQWEDRSMLAGNVAVFTSDVYSGIEAPVNVSGMDWGLSYRMEWQISENVRFGMGARFNSNKSEREYDRELNNTQMATYDDGDNQPDDPDDYTTIIEREYNSTLTYETITDNVEIPAGIEVNVGKNKDWFIRMGAIAIKQNVNYKEMEVIDEVQGERTTTIYGDGDTTVTYEDVEYGSYKENEYSESQSVNFAYGLGWKPSENISIDLLGIFDASGTELLSTDWFRSLKLSATVSF